MSVAVELLLAANPHYRAYIATGEPRHLQAAAGEELTDEVQQVLRAAAGYLAHDPEVFALLSEMRASWRAARSITSAADKVPPELRAAHACYHFYALDELHTLLAHKLPGVRSKVQALTK